MIGERPDQILVAAAPTLVALMAWTSARDPFEASKFALLLLLVGVWAFLALRRAATSGAVSIPTSPWALAVLAFLAAGALAVVTAANPESAMYGLPARYSGWLTYASAALLGLAASRNASVALVKTFTTVTLCGLCLLGGYGLLQLIGVEPLPVTNAVPGVFVTLSNPNFAGGWAGSLAGMAMCQISRSGASVGRRLLGGGGFAGAVLIVLGAGSTVGFVALATSVGVVILATLWVRGGISRRLLVPLVSVAGLLGATLIGLGVFQTGPFAAIGAEAGIGLRRFYWSAALRMLRDNPGTGVGFDGFLWAYRNYRGVAAADAVALSLETDAAHSAPLQLASGGGLPLALTYVILSGVVVWAIFRVLASDDQSRHRIVGELAPVWTGLFAQSLASFDLTSHIVLSMVSAGLIAGVAWPDGHSSFSLPGVVRTAAVRSTKRGKRGRPQRDRTVIPTWMTPVMSIVGVLSVMVAVVVGTRPVRSEIQAHEALVLEASESFVESAQVWGNAADISGWEPDYPYRQGLALLQAGDTATAVPAFESTLARNPNHLGGLISLARTLDSLGRGEEAAAQLKAALIVEPNNVDLKVEAAQGLLEEDYSMAQNLVSQVEERQPANPSLADLRVLLDQFAPDSAGGSE